jgi:hypothetical protein
MEVSSAEVRPVEVSRAEVSLEEADVGEIGAYQVGHRIFVRTAPIVPRPRASPQNANLLLIGHGPTNLDCRRCHRNGLYAQRLGKRIRKRVAPDHVDQHVPFSVIPKAMAPLQPGLKPYQARSLTEASTMPMSRDAALIEATAKHVAQQAAVAMERASTRGERAAERQLKRTAASLALNSGGSFGSNRRSPREIQEIIRAVFAAHPTRAFPTKDLCNILYPDLPTRVHIVKTSHAARKIVAADPHWTCEFSSDRRQVVFFNRANESSVAIAEEMLASAAGPVWWILLLGGKYGSVTG